MKYFRFFKLWLYESRYLLRQFHLSTVVQSFRVIWQNVNANDIISELCATNERGLQAANNNPSLTILSLQ